MDATIVDAVDVSSLAEYDFDATTDRPLVSRGGSVVRARGSTLIAADGSVTLEKLASGIPGSAIGFDDYGVPSTYRVGNADDEQSIATVANAIYLITKATNTPEKHGYNPLGTLASQDAAIQAWVTEVKLTGFGGLGSRVYNFLLNIDFTGYRVSIFGNGRALSILRYKGLSTTADIFKAGGVSKSSPLMGLSLRDFQVQTDVDMTDGSCIVVQHAIGGASLLNVSPDERAYVGGGSKLFHGASFINTNVSEYKGFLIPFPKGDGIRVAGVEDADTASDLSLDAGWVVGASGTGLHVGGGFGGLYVGQVLLFGCRYNSRVTVEITNRMNREIFFGSQSVHDGGWICNMSVNDPLTAGGMLVVDGFVGSAGLDPFTKAPRPEPEYVGDNIHIAAWAGTFSTSSKKIFNAKRHGIALDSASTVVSIPSDTFMANNAGFALYSSVPTENVTCNAIFGTGAYANGADISGNIRQYRSYIPSVGSATGALGSYTSAMRYRKVGATAHFSVTVHIDVNGPVATGALAISTPFAAREKSVATGIADSVAGRGVTAVLPANDTYMSVRFSGDGGYPGADGETITITGTVEVY